MYFLLEYDRGRGELVRIESFAPADRTRAERMRLDLELALNRSGITDREVVILEAASEQALRRTHLRYFEDLAGIASSFGRD